MDKLNKEINVLIPDGERVLALFTINCLSMLKNVKIHLLSKKKWTETRFSRKVGSFNYYTDVKTDEEWIEIIKKEIVKRKINVLFPVEIEDIRLLSKYRDDFKPFVPNLILPSTDSFDISNNKWSLHKFLIKNSINSPTTVHIKDFNQLNLSELTFPVLLKPLVGMGGFGIKKVDNEASLKSFVQNDNNFIVQNIIKGFDIDVSVLCENGTILAYTIQKGNIFSTALYSAPIGVEFLYNKELFLMIKKLIEKMNWSGFAHIDLRYDESEGNFKVLEINPRVWGSIEASEKVGVNFPFLYCLSSLGINYDLPEYRFENFVNNIGLLKVLKSKIKKKTNKYQFPKNTLIENSIRDPLPILYKFFMKK